MTGLFSANRSLQIGSHHMTPSQPLAHAFHHVGLIVDWFAVALKNYICSGDLIVVTTEDQNDVVEKCLAAHRDVFSLIEQFHNMRYVYRFLEGRMFRNNCPRFN